MKIAITGSRSITDNRWIYKAMKAALPGAKVHLDSAVWLVGGAEGVDQIAKDWCKFENADCVTFLPYFKLDKTATFNNAHFFTRNRQLVQNADKVLVLWDGKSKGTKYTMEYAKKLGKEVVVNIYKGEE